jgi:hypothetical protein
MIKTKQSKPNHNTYIKTNDDCRNHTIKVNLLSFSYKDPSHTNRLVIPFACDIDEILLKVTLSTINQSINITQQLKHLITMYKLFCRMYSHYLHKTLGQSYYPTAEDFDYHVRQSIEMFNNYWFIVLNATFSNISSISWRPILVVEEAGVPGENHRPFASNW